MATRFNPSSLDATFNLQERWREILAAILIVALVIFAVAYPVTAAYFEAAAFNRLTGGHVTTWDALFLELRVDGNPL